MPKKEYPEFKSWKNRN